MQATLGGVAYQLNLIPGPQGLNKGIIIKQGCAFAVLLFAPLGAFLTSELKILSLPLASFLCVVLSCWTCELLRRVAGSFRVLKLILAH